MRLRWGLGFALILLGCPGDDTDQTCDSEDCDSEGAGSDTGMTSAMTTMNPTSGSDTGVTTMNTTGPNSDTTVAMDSTGETSAGCGGDDECTDAAAPFCVDSVCSPCSATDDPAAACQGLEPTTPLCIDDACVACTAQPMDCAGTTPVCDDGSGACLPCTEHAQCPDSACHAFVGSCLDPGTVFYVNAAAGAGGDGTVDMPFATIGEALAAIPAGAEGTIRVDEAITTYNEALLVDGDRVVAILGIGGGVPDLRSPMNAPALDVDGSTTYVESFNVIGNDIADSVEVVDGAIDIRRSIVGFNDDGIGIDAMGSDVRLLASEVYLNQFGGVVMVGGTLEIVNSVIAGNGLFNQPTSALNLEDVDFSILYTTVANNFGGGSNNGPVEATLECRGASDGEVRNSILLAPDPDQIDNMGCPTMEANNSAVDTMDLDGSGSVVVGYDADFFVNPFAPNFHLDPAFMDSPFDGLAVWQEGDPIRDFDGDARPTVDNDPDWAGYDVP